MYSERYENSPSRPTSRRVVIVNDSSRYRKRDRSRSRSRSPRYRKRDRSRSRSPSPIGYTYDSHRSYKRSRMKYEEDEDSELTLVLQDPDLVRQNVGRLVEYRKRPATRSDYHSMILLSCKPYHLFQFWSTLTLREMELENTKEFRLAICAGHSRDLERLLHYHIFHRSEEQMIHWMDPLIYSWTDFRADIQTLAVILRRRRRQSTYHLPTELMQQRVERVDIHRMDPDGGYSRKLSALLADAYPEELDQLQREQRGIIDHMITHAFSGTDPTLQPLRGSMTEWWNKLSGEEKDNTTISRYIFVLRRYLGQSRGDIANAQSSISFQLD